MFFPRGSQLLRTVLVVLVASGVVSVAAQAWADDVWATRLSGRLSDSDVARQSVMGRAVSIRLADDASNQDAVDAPSSSQDAVGAPSKLPQIDAAPLPCGGCDDPGCSAAGSCEQTAEDGSWCDRRCDDGWFDNALVFLAGDGWKNIFDDDDNNNFGFRSGFNLGFGLPGKRAVRGQVGMSYGAYDFHGREGLLSRDDPIEQQIFATAGIYKRSDIVSLDRWAWGAVYDLLIADDAGERADSLRLGQLRSYIGYAVRETDEIGVWAALRLMRDYAPQQRVMVNTTDQVNLFWHHNWALGGDTTGYVGWADDPGSVVIGLNGRVPLNHRVALFGNVHYIIPSTTGGDVHPTLEVDDVFNQEAWNVSFGIVFFFGAKAAAPNVSGHYGLPLIPVADNGTFSYQAAMF